MGNSRNPSVSYWMNVFEGAFQEAEKALTKRQLASLHRDADSIRSWRIKNGAPASMVKAGSPGWRLLK